MEPMHGAVPLKSRVEEVFIPVASVGVPLYLSVGILRRAVSIPRAVTGRGCIRLEFVVPPLLCGVVALGGVRSGRTSKGDEALSVVAGRHVSLGHVRVVQNDGAGWWGRVALDPGLVAEVLRRRDPGLLPVQHAVHRRELCCMQWSQSGQVALFRW